MKVLIGLPHIDNKIHGKFVESLTSLLAYSNAHGIQTETMHTYRTDITFARNKIASWAIRDPFTQYLFFLDDDMVFAPDTLEILIKKHVRERAASWRLGVLGALTFVRSEPHYPSMWIQGSDKRTYNPLEQWNEKELVSCDAIGMAATLIDTKTLMDIAKGSQYYNNIFAIFDNFDNLGEDFRFCRKAKDLSWDIMCDTSQIVGHIVETIVGYGDYALYRKASHDEALKFVLQKQYGNGKKKENNKEKENSKKEKK